MSKGFYVKFYENINLNDELLHQIIEVKSKQWHYSFEQHKEWIEKNIGDNDIHVLLFLDDKVVAYLNLVNILVDFDGQMISCLGLGNVCAIERVKGYGFELVKRANHYLISHEKTGLLFCRTPLLNFYTSLGWTSVEANKYQIPLLTNEIMILNAPNNFNLMKYDGKLF